MMNDERNMDKLFREKMDGFNAEPPAHLWDGIQMQMAAMQRKKRMGYYRWASVAALLMLAFLAGWYFNSDTAIQSGNEMAESETAPLNNFS